MVQPSKPRRPTQSDVARLAEVSQTMVSLVLNGQSNVSIAPETRTRVLAAIEELNYVPDGAARSLRTSRTQIVACVIPDITNPFYPQFERGVQDVAESYDYDLIIYNSDGVRAKELKCIRSLQRARVDGLIVTPFQMTIDDLAPLAERGVPVVIFGEMKQEPATALCDSVFVDDDAAAVELVTYLAGQGYRPLAMIGGPADVARREGRIRAWREVLEARDEYDEGWLVRGSDPTEEGGRHAMHQLLSHDSLPRAVFAANDMMALGAIAAINERGLRVPEDIAVAGFDDIPVARLVNPPLTTVAQFPTALGRRAAEMLFERLSGEYTGPGRRELLQYKLVVRASA